MPNALNHPSGTMLLDEVRTIFETKQIVQKNDRHIIFVCGGSIKNYSRSARKKFLKYAKKNLSDFRIFLAETASKDLTNYDKPKFINIAEFESLVTNIADCIILFPESPGSIAEMGFFANSKACENLLIVADTSRQSDSFITIGITELVNRKSNFRSTIVFDYKKPEFDIIKDRLNDRLPNINTKKFVFNTSIDDYSSKELLYIIFQIIFIFRALRYEAVLFCVDKIFGKPKRILIKQLLSILIAAKYIERIGDHSEYFCPNKDATPFLEFRKYEVNTLIAKVIGFYQKNDRETYNLLNRGKS